MRTTPQNQTRKNQTRNYRNWIMAATSVAALAVICPGAANAQCTLGGPVSIWQGGNGEWDGSSLHWNNGIIPDSSTQSACITNGTATVTIQNNSITVDNLQLGFGNGLLITNAANSRSLSVYGTQIINAGTITLSSTSSAANASLLLDNNVVLTGGGTVVLSEAFTPNTNGFAEILAEQQNTTLENFNNTIEGAGRIDSGPNLSFVNDAGGTVNANVSGGTFILSSFNITNNGLFEATNGGELNITNAFSNAGQMQTSTGGSIQVNVGFTNQTTGQVSVGQGTSFTAEVTYENKGQTTVDGTLTTTTMTNDNGGTLQGTGTIYGDLFNYGTVKPGDGLTAGTLTLGQGGYTQGSTGTLQIGIGGTNAGQYSQLIDYGTATLAGKLAVDLLNGFTFANGEMFDILNAHAFSGDFTSFSLDNVTCSSGGTDIWDCGNGLTLTEEFVFHNGEPNPPVDQLWLEANVVPEPSTLLPLGSALAAFGTMMFLRRRKMTSRI